MYEEELLAKEIFKSIILQRSKPLLHRSSRSPPAELLLAARARCTTFLQLLQGSLNNHSLFIFALSLQVPGLFPPVLYSLPSSGWKPRLEVMTSHFSLGRELQVKFSRIRSVFQ